MFVNAHTKIMREGAIGKITRATKTEMTFECKKKILVKAGQDLMETKQKLSAYQWQLEKRFVLTPFATFK